MTQKFAKWGALESVKFENVAPEGYDVYIVTFKNARVLARVAPAMPDGKFPGLRFGELQ